MKISKSFVTLFMVFITTFALALFPSTVKAQKLTGGAEWTEAGSIVFSVTANALMTPRGDIKGHIQYTRENQPGIADLIVHAAVECFGISGDGGIGSIAVAAGPAAPQYDPNVVAWGWLVIFVKEGGTGSGDTVRVIFAHEGGESNSGTARYYCAHPTANTIFPGYVQEGNFTIRP